MKYNEKKLLKFELEESRSDQQAAWEELLEATERLKKIERKVAKLKAKKK